MKVYAVTGWFGDIEWIERPLYESEEEALERAAVLWETRTSEMGPDYARGLHKFGVEGFRVKPARRLPPRSDHLFTSDKGQG